MIENRVRFMSPAKLGGELHASAAAIAHGIRSTGRRFFNVPGPGLDRGSPYSGLISRFHGAVAGGEGITVFGDGSQGRDFVFVDEVVRALLAAGIPRAGAPAEMFNVCKGMEASVLDLAAKLADLKGRLISVTNASPRAGDIRRSSGAPAGLKTMLGQRPHTNLADRFRILIEWGED